jgi:hypothetical protein
VDAAERAGVGARDTRGYHLRQLVGYGRGVDWAYWRPEFRDGLGGGGPRAAPLAQPVVVEVAVVAHWRLLVLGVGCDEGGCSSSFGPWSFLGSTTRQPPCLSVGSICWLPRPGLVLLRQEHRLSIASTLPAPHVAALGAALLCAPGHAQAHPGDLSHRGLGGTARALLTASARLSLLLLSPLGCPMYWQVGLPA